VRQACIKYLQRWFVFFYPERPQIVEQAKQLASELGGRLETPTLPWKYAWIQKLFGWELGKRAWFNLPKLRSELSRRWDKTLFHLEPRSLRALASPIVANASTERPTG